VSANDLSQVHVPSNEPKSRPHTQVGGGAAQISPWRTTRMPFFHSIKTTPDIHRQAFKTIKLSAAYLIRVKSGCALALERDAKVQARQAGTHMLDPGARAVARSALPANPFLGLTPPSVTPLTR
jgi:hypothetical protein